MNATYNNDSIKNSNKNPHLVVIDDDLEIQELIFAFFKPKGYSISTYNDAETALKDLKLKGNDWDVILSDLNLPHMSGVEFTEKVKSLQPDMPIILITISKSAESAVEAIEKGAYDFIVKPLHFPQLLISVERALKLKKLNHNIVELRNEVKTSKSVTDGSIIGKSPKFVASLDIARRVASSQANIFIHGESGTGKEVFAKYIHNQSARNKGPFVAINCSAIPENLLESELFGHAKGSFTGAHDKKIGLFEEAQDGTLFLDEIGDLSLALQAKLLRVLQERKIKRVGENQYRDINCRIISATHKNLADEVTTGNFREDLYFRLNVIPIKIPPLRERKDDILPLAENFLKKFALINASPAKQFSTEAIKYVLENDWKGNVRELENSVERAVVLAGQSEIQLEHFLPEQKLQSIQSGSATFTEGTNQFVIGFDDTLPTLDDVVQKYVEFAVNINGGAKDRTAKEIGIDRKTLYKKLKTNENELQ